MKSLVGIIFKFQLHTNAHVQYQLFQTKIKYLQNLKIKQTISLESHLEESHYFF